MKLFIYSYENIYRGRHGIADFDIADVDEDCKAAYIWENYIVPASIELMEGYNFEVFKFGLEPEDFNTDEEFYEALAEVQLKNVAGEIYKIKDTELSNLELCELAYDLGAEAFIEEYCEEEL